MPRRIKSEQVSGRRSTLRRGRATRSARFPPAEALLGAPAQAYDVRYPRLDLLIEIVAEILNSEVALYYRLDGPGQSPEVVCSWGLGALHDQLARPREGGLVDRALGVQRAVFEALDPDRDAVLIRAAGDGNLAHALIAPVRPPTGSAAVLIAAFPARPRDQALALWAAEACAQMLALGAHRPEFLSTILSASRLDALTGCLNYAGIRRELETEINRSTRADLSLSLGFVDLNGFKRVNDEHGHLRGNEVLREVSRVLRESVRSCDTVGRFGGDEFIVILPDTDERAAMRFAARLRARLRGASIPAAGGPVTASIGVAPWTRGATADELLARADEALLRAKAHARGIARPEARARASGPSAVLH